MIDGTSDASLVLALRADEPGAFEAFYGRYERLLYTVCRRELDDHEAYDVFHDTIIQAWQRIWDLRDPDCLRPWLCRIAQRNAKRVAVRRRRAPSTDMSTADVPTIGLGPEEKAQDAEWRTLVARAANGLSEQDRRVLELHFHQGLQGQELADALGVSRAYAYQLTHRLPARLEDCLRALSITGQGPGTCRDLDRLLSAARWDGALTPALRRKLVRHIDQCQRCGDRSKDRISAEAPLGRWRCWPYPPS